MNREEIIQEVARIIARSISWEDSEYPDIAREILDWLDSIGYDPCFELGINIHNHPTKEPS